MKSKLFKSEKIYIGQSQTHGYGVFCNQDIKKGELIEECYYLTPNESKWQDLDKTFLNTNEKLVKMFEDQIPEDRQQVLRDIDSIMCNMLEVEPNDLPWINPNKHDEKWEILMNKLRLVVGRIEYASKQKNRTVH